MNLEIKSAEVKYIDSGSFQGDEEYVYLAGIKRDETCRVVKKRDYDLMLSAYNATIAEGIRPEGIAEVAACLYKTMSHMRIVKDAASFDVELYERMDEALENLKIKP